MIKSNEDLITDEVLECFKKLLSDLEVVNYTIDVSLGSGHGENYSGTIAKVSVKIHNKTVKSFIIKSATRNEQYRLMVPVRQSFIREDYIYSTVLPAFISFQDDKRIQNPFNSIAKFYKSSMEYNNEAIIMEDMKQYGFSTYNRLKPIDYNHAVLVMKEYGKFHATSFALRDQKPDIFEEIVINTPESFFNGKCGENFLTIVQPQGIRALNSLDKITDREIYEKFKTFQENMKYSLLNTLQPDAAGKYAVICHGDCWSTNMLFRYLDPEKPETPTDLCLLDWQLSRSGSPVLDLSYFIFTCTDKELRDKHYQQLLDEYYKSLCDHLRKLGSDPDNLFPFTVFQEHLKKFSVYGLFMTIICLFMMTSEVDEIPDLHKVSDVDGLTEILKFESKNVEIYNRRIRGVILDFVRLGYDM